MKNLEDLNLTERDFDMIVEGLEELPMKGSTGELMTGMLGAMLTKDDPEAREKQKREFTADRLKKEAAKKDIIEEVRILQGKLLTFKRYLIEKGLMVEANQALHKITNK